MVFQSLVNLNKLNIQNCKGITGNVMVFQRLVNLKKLIMDHCKGITGTEHTHGIHHRGADCRAWCTCTNMKLVP